MSTLPAIEPARYIEKINSIHLQSCPFSLPASSWCNNPTQWPEVSYPDIYFYLMESPREQITSEIFYFSVLFYK